ncbi:MAG: DUF885 domain-containing protein [Trueperella sp.]|nr:DUF885 domain-containing protein [Trueperella sp.]
MSFEKTARAATAIDELAESYVAQSLELSPGLVTVTGLPGASETQFDDYSPAGLAAQAELDQHTLQQLETLTPQDETDRITVAAMQERLGLAQELYQAAEFGELNVIATPLQEVQQLFDLMPQESNADWRTIAARLQAVPQALASWRETLTLRAQSGPDTARRQVLLCAEQADNCAGKSSPFIDLAERGTAAFSELGTELADGVAAARQAYGELAEFLRTEILPQAVESDAFGRERYERRIRQFVGAKVDLDETYEWGLTELARIRAEQQEIAHELYGAGVSVAEAMERLNQDPQRTIHGTENLQRWMQETSDQAIAALQGSHFDIPAPLQKLECMIAPSATGAIYYTGPSDDFSRPGRMWWSVPEGTETFATWQEKTTVFHEGVPGHHLQLGMTTYLREQLNTWRRQLCWVSGHGEGWALYAESLMAELGYQEDPGDYMGVLDSEQLRTARVALDIGVHLQKETPAEFREISPTWTRDVAWEFLRSNLAMDSSFLEFELNRYLGWAGQAPSYKIGQRIWRQLRAEAEARPNFNLKDWHMKALSIGSVGLDVLRAAL